METDIGEFTQQSTNQSPIDQDDYNSASQYQFQQPQSQYFPQQQQQYFAPEKKVDIFAELGKTAYIIIFVAFILGFFMGKTMQPVILRPN